MEYWALIWTFSFYSYRQYDKSYKYGEAAAKGSLVSKGKGADYQV